MSVLLKDIMSNVTLSLVQSVAYDLGESEKEVTKALGGMVPILLAGIIGKSRNGSAMNKLFSTLTDPKSSKLLDDLETMVSSGGFMRVVGNNDLVGSFVKGLFGDKTSSTLSTFSSQSGLKDSSPGPLMNVAAQLVMGYLNSSIARNGFDIESFLGLLKSEKDSILSALPPDMGGTLYHAGAMEKLNAPARSHKFSLIIGLIVLGSFVFWAWRSFITPQVHAPLMNSPALNQDSITSATMNAIKTSMQNAQDWIHILDNGYELIGDSTGIERNIIQFLSSNKEVDTITWFNCDHMAFRTGSAQLDKDESQNQLNNLAEIMKVYPNVDLKIGGYTDNNGTSAANLNLSQERADAVRTALIKMGINSKRMESEGYGDQYPVAGNNTEEGRMQNRRIAIRVTAK